MLVSYSTSNLGEVLFGGSNKPNCKVGFAERYFDESIPIRDSPPQQQEIIAVSIFLFAGGFST